MYEVIGGTQSRAFRVMWMLEELDQPYTHTAVKPHSAEALAANPSGKLIAFAASPGANPAAGSAASLASCAPNTPTPSK